MQDLLGTTLILLVACSLAAALTARLNIPTLLGYLLVGVLLGPPVTAWIMPGPALNFLSELGVALVGGALLVAASIRSLPASASTAASPASGKKLASLLAGGAVFSNVVAVDQYFKIVAVRADECVAGCDLGLDAHRLDLDGALRLLDAALQEQTRPARRARQGA